MSRGPFFLVDKDRVGYLKENDSAKWVWYVWMYCLEGGGKKGKATQGTERREREKGSKEEKEKKKA